MISIDTETATPPFEQIRTQLRQQIVSGQLIAGTRLPTVRRLASDLGLAPNTVARAYKELEISGFVVTRGRAGTLVADSDDAVRQQAESAALAFARSIKKLGVDWDDAVALASMAYRQS